MNAAAYLRVSTSKQADSGLSLEEQERRVRTYSDSQGWDLAELFVDAGISGRKESRPQLDKLLGRLDDFGAVIVPKLDRLGRSTKHLLQLYARLEDAGVRFVVLDPPIDTSSSSGRLQRTLLSAFAEFEAELISERTAAASAARVRKGKHHGGIPYGHRVAQSGGLEPDPAESVIVGRIFREYAAGASQRAIMRALNEDGIRTRKGALWTQSGVRHVLTNPVHVGRVRINGEEFEGSHDPLIDRETFDRVAARLSTGARKRGRPPAGSHLFTRGLLRCAHCGSAMWPRKDSHNGRETYQCRGRLENGPEFCPQAPIPREAIDSPAFGYFERIGFDVAAAEEELRYQALRRREEAAALLSDQEAQRRALEATQERWDKLLAEEGLTVEEWRELKAKTQAELTAARERERILRERLAELEADSSAEEAAQRVAERLAELRAAVAGEIRSAEGLEGVRERLRALFERFDVGRLDLPPAEDLPVPLAEARAQALAAIAEEELTDDMRRWVILPWPAPELVDRLNYEWRPSLTNNSAGSSRRR